MSISLLPVAWLLLLLLVVPLLAASLDEDAGKGILQRPFGGQICTARQAAAAGQQSCQAYVV